jgi:hypothetical protein
VTPTSIEVNQTALVTVSLGNVPSEGYASAEFVCTYDANLVSTGNIVIADRFGSEPATAINDPQNGSFIVAIAGSNGQKATTSGTVFTFSVTGLQVGQTLIECKARVSKGDGTLTEITSVSTNLTIVADPPSAPAPTSSTSSSPSTSPMLSGQVIASKPPIVNLYNMDNSLATSVITDAGGNFSLTAPAGTYTIVATASGFLSAQGPVTLTAGKSSTKSTINLVAGDIDGNSVIDQFDAMTIGMSYNSVVPDVADLNGDGVINLLDLEVLALNYRRSGALDWQ